jgi:hypothetical protein
LESPPFFKYQHPADKSLRSFVARFRNAQQVLDETNSREAMMQNRIASLTYAIRSATGALAFFLGLFAPFFRASERPIAMACLRLVTFLPDFPDFSVPRFSLCIARLTLEEAAFPYFRVDFFAGISGSSM